MRIRIPANNWQPRPYQIPAWDYWVANDGRHMELIWHRRSGKDEVVLHGTCVKAHERVANYWHMLPLANQVRKAIWDAVNPRTGHRRIDEAFPRDLRESTRDQDMMIRFKNGSTWQALGSDNYQAAIGSTPAGIVYSEWSQANPSARGYLRPILTENEGWQVYITTPRGKNHAYNTYKAAKDNPHAFAQLLTVEDTGVLTLSQLEEELAEYISTYGIDMGTALYQQEYYCSFDAAILGSIWGGELSKADKEGRTELDCFDPDYPVFTAWDIGRTDATAIWWYQVIGNEPRIIDFYQNSLKDPDHFASQLLAKRVQIDLIDTDIVVSYGDDIPEISHRKAYRYEMNWLPHDARAKTFAAKGKSVLEQLIKVFGAGKVRITPDLSKQDGIQAARLLINTAVFDRRCEEGMEAIKQYRYEWDDDRKCFRDNPVHDWTSHPADALRYLAVAWQQSRPETQKDTTIKDIRNTSFNDLWALDRPRNRERI